MNAHIIIERAETTAITVLVQAVRTVQFNEEVEDKLGILMDPIWLLIAFIFGFISKQIGLPPLVGFLIAGFVLNAFGIEKSELIEIVSDYGILLLLFSIGLKLKIKNLLRLEIIGTATLHMAVSLILFSSIFYLLGLFSIFTFANLPLPTLLLISFALSFSSTVFAVKILEETGEMASPFGNAAIGILVLQDIFAVIFLSISKGEVPSVWALALLALLIIPKLLKIKPLSLIIDKAGHGELLVLLGILLPIGTAQLFNAVNLKPDLGALIIGIILANHSKADEISRSMLGFKDLFLVGFFLSIGLSESPTVESFYIALFLILLLPFKTLLFFALQTKFNLKARTSFLASLSLTNFSEFGLIVGAVGVKAGWLSSEWLVIFAVALSLSFLISAPFNKYANFGYAKLHDYLLKFESNKRLPYEMPINLGSSEILIIGMGKMGTAAYSALHNNYGVDVLGIDFDLDIIEKHKRAKRNVLLEDATNTDLWERACSQKCVKVIVITLNDHTANLTIIEELKEFGFGGKIIATGFYPDEMKEIREAGAYRVFNFHTEAGAGFADDIYQHLEN